MQTRRHADRPKFVLLACALVWTHLACSEGPIEQRYDFLVRVTSDPGRPVAGARVMMGGEPVGVSGEDGLIYLQTAGGEGHTLALRISCPEGHEAPSEPLSIVLRRVREAAHAPAYAVRCAPTLRVLVVVVRAEHGKSLPVRYLGKEVARTDAAGVAHVLLRTPPEESVELLLDTSENPRIRPQNPVARFETSAQDALQLFEPKFQVEPPPKRPRRPRPTNRPVRIR